MHGGFFSRICYKSLTFCFDTQNFDRFFSFAKGLGQESIMLKLSSNNAATAAVIAVFFLFRRLSCVSDLHFHR